LNCRMQFFELCLKKAVHVRISQEPTGYQILYKRFHKCLRPLPDHLWIDDKKIIYGKICNFFVREIFLKKGSICSQVLFDIVLYLTENDPVKWLHKRKQLCVYASSVCHAWLKIIKKDTSLCLFPTRSRLMNKAIFSIIGSIRN